MATVKGKSRARPKKSVRSRVLASQRIALLVDSENVEIAIMRQSRSGRPNWQAIIDSVVNGRTLVRNVYYKKRERSVTEAFKTFWEKQLAGEVKQPIKSVDPYIIVDAISICEKVDVLVILAGDKDYLPLIWYLKSKGCKVEMASFEEAAASVVKWAADKFYKLGDHHISHRR